jgi:tRNA 2-thiocytidine biosynthesis protein TtcA
VTHQNMSERDKNQREHLKREKRLIRLMSQAIADFRMIEAHDRVMVCVSGGKDSLTLLHLLLTLQKRTSTPFELIAFNLDQGQPGFPTDTLPAFFQQINVPYHIERQDTYSVVTRLIEPGKTQCSLCSRMRRGVIYRVAESLGVNKIALGHHRDDVLATFFLNLFYGSQLKAMSAKLRSDDGKTYRHPPPGLCGRS